MWKLLVRTYQLVYLFILRNKIYHLVFWLVYILFVSFLVSPSSSFWDGIFPASSIISLHALVAYFNLYLLIPSFLYHRKYFLYIFSLGLSILLVCFPLAIIISNFFPNNTFLAANSWTPWFFFANSLYILLTVSLTSFTHLFSEWYRKERINKDLEKINIQNELKYLKSQINPHFLFNSLNNLYAMTLKKSDDAPEMVLRLSNILRYVLYETGEAKVPLDKEINYLKDLLELEKIRIGERVNIELQVKGNTEGILIEPLLFINFVENSFKHGINTVWDAAWVKINIDALSEENILKFEIENSKPIDNKEDKNERPGGIGLINAQKRLKLLYPNKHKLEIKQTEQTYSVKLILNLS